MRYVGLAYPYVHGLDEEGCVMKTWGKLPYPTFMENNDCAVFVGKEKLWQGKCYFSWRTKRAQAQDSLSRNLEGLATIRADLQDVFGGLRCGELVFLVWVGGLAYRFLVEELRCLYNPDGSFHHMRFRLIDAAELGQSEAIWLVDALATAGEHCSPLRYKW